MGKLTGKVAWVTGAGTGIGAASARALAAEGAAIVLTGRRQDKLEETAATVGPAARVLAADLSKSAEAQRAADAVLTHHGRIDILVNNAGTNIVERNWQQLTPAGIDTLLQVNLASAFYCTTAVLPAMRAQGGGLLIHVSSLAGRFILPLSGPGYTAAKHAMVAMSHSLNQQEFLNNIRSTCVCPGEVNTEFLKTRPLQLTEEDVARMLQPSDVGELIAFIATRPAHLCVNEVLVTPTWNRAYAAQFPRRP